MANLFESISRSLQAVVNRMWKSAENFTIKRCNLFAQPLSPLFVFTKILNFFSSLTLCTIVLFRKFLYAKKNQLFRYPGCLYSTVHYKSITFARVTVGLYLYVNDVEGKARFNFNFRTKLLANYAFPTRIIDLLMDCVEGK